jgi:hypothetical protein
MAAEAAEAAAAKAAAQAKSQAASQARVEAAAAAAAEEAAGRLALAAVTVERPVAWASIASDADEVSDRSARCTLPRKPRRSSSVG